MMWIAVSATVQGIAYLAGIRYLIKSARHLAAREETRPRD